MMHTPLSESAELYLVDRNAAVLQEASKPREKPDAMERQQRDVRESVDALLRTEQPPAALPQEADGGVTVPQKHARLRAENGQRIISELPQQVEEALVHLAHSFHRWKRDRREQRSEQQRLLDALQKQKMLATSEVGRAQTLTLTRQQEIASQLLTALNRFRQSTDVPEDITFQKEIIARWMESIALQNAILAPDVRLTMAARLLFGCSAEEVTFLDDQRILRAIEKVQSVENPDGKFGSLTRLAQAKFDALHAALSEGDRHLALDQDDEMLLLELDLLGTRDAHDVLAGVAERMGRPVERIDQIGQGGQGRIFRLVPKKMEALTPENTAKAITAPIEGIRAMIAKISLEKDDSIDEEVWLGQKAALAGSAPHSYRSSRPDIALFMAEEDGACTLNAEEDDGARTLHKYGIKLSDERTWLPFALRLTEQVQKLHDAHITHRDLKPANILVRQDGVPLLIDFGLSMEMPADASISIDGVAGTPAYIAPEAWEGIVSSKGDVYALGCILYEELTGREWCAAGSVDSSRYVHLSLRDHPEKLQEALSVVENLQIRKILLRMLEPNPQMRLTAAQAGALFQKIQREDRGQDRARFDGLSSAA